MARKWAVFDDWSGGGFFNNGSFRGAGRFRSLNMQRYQNGSIGPRPQFRKLTQTADSGSSIPSVAAASGVTRMWGGGWSSWAPSGWEHGAVLLVAQATGNCRRIRINDDGTCVYFAAAEIGQLSVGPVDQKPGSEATGIHFIKPVVDGSNPVYISGSILYDPSANTKSNITPQVISAVNFYPAKIVLYKNRMYGWEPPSGTNGEYIAYSKDTDLSDFAGTDNAGNFRLSVAPAGFTPALPRGLWPLRGGLLIFSSEGVVRRSTRYDGVTAPLADFGRWYMLTGPNITAGTLSPLGYDTGPLFHSLAVVYDDKLLFPIQGAGWAIHDGSRLDKTSLESLSPRPISDDTRRIHWLHPFSIRNEDALFLPYFQFGADPNVLDATGPAPRVGEFHHQGYGGLEFVNGTWTENLYLHGHGSLSHFESLDQDKVYMIHHDSDDGGTTYFPQVWTREITLNRPSTATDLDVRNPFSNGVEEDPGYNIIQPATGAWGAKYMAAFVETAEFHAVDYSTVTAESIVVDYDYWNSELFNSDCGFDLEITYRSQRDNTQTTARVSSTRITPPGTSINIFPKRGRAIINLPERIGAGTFQVRAVNVKDVAFHSFAVAYDDGNEAYTAV